MSRLPDTVPLSWIAAAIIADATAAGNLHQLADDVRRATAILAESEGATS